MPDTFQQPDRGSAGAYASYFAGMDKSMQQKVALTTAHFPVRGTVADMGSGSGRGTYDLACLHPQLQLVGVDIDPVAVRSAAAAFQRPNLRYLAGDIADPLFPPESLDGILDSSVLHHVTSFTGFATGRLEQGLDHQVAALRPDGVLIIRDFVVPEGPSEVLLDLPTGDGADDGDIVGLSTAALWRRYAATVRNSRHRRRGALPWAAVAGAPPGRQRVRLALRDAQEFLLRKDYRADWDAELREEYTYWTQAEFVRALERRGLRVVAAAPIRNPWIVANRYRGKVALHGLDGASLPFPPTNLVVVGQRVAGGIRLRRGAVAPVAAPAFLRLHAYAGSDGAVYDLAERPGRTVDVVPWRRADGQLLVGARHGVPRPIVVADQERPNLTGARWSGWLTEPIAAITGADEALGAAVTRILGERAGIAAPAIRALSEAVRYATSPGGLDEVVTAVLAEVDDAAPSACAWLDARACLRAAQVGGMFDARLELGVYRLLRRLGVAPGAWIGAALALPAAPGAWPLAAEALRPPERPRFMPLPRPTGYLALRAGEFAELAADGAVVATTTREWVQPTGATSNTALALPLTHRAGQVLVGLEHRWLPAIQRATGRAGLATAPAWRLPATVERLDQAESFVAARLAGDHGCEVAELVELGGPWLPTPGATPELVHPWAAVLSADSSPGTLHWLPLAELVAQADGIVDAHLAIACQRAGHALGITESA